jgi:hypothetical protein
MIGPCAIAEITAARHTPSIRSLRIEASPFEEVEEVEVWGELRRSELYFE